MKVLDWLSRPERRRPRNTCLLLDLAQVPVNTESNINRCAIGKWRLGARGGWPFHATHYVIMATSETLSFLRGLAKSNGDLASKFDRSEEESEN